MSSRTHFVLVFAILGLTCASSVQAAAIGEQCETGYNVPQSALCQGTAFCLQSISNKYCSNPGMVCGWGSTGGYLIGAQKTYQGNTYQCTPSGFIKVASSPPPAPATPEQMIAGMWAVQQPIEVIVNVARATFDLNGGQMAAALHGASIPISSSGLGLRSVFGPTLNTLGAWMVDAGWSRGSVAGVLQSLFSASPTQIAQFLSDLPNDQVAATLTVLRNIFADLDASAAAASLQLAGYSAEAALSAVAAAFNLSVYTLAQVGVDAGFPLASVAAVVQMVAGTISMAAEAVLFVTEPDQAALLASAHLLAAMGATREVVHEAALILNRWAEGVIQAVLDQVFGALSSVAPAKQGFFANPEIMGVSIGFPDVCKTPTPAGPVPIPYPNISNTPGVQDLRLPDSVKRTLGERVAIPGSEFPSGQYRLASGDLLRIYAHPTKVGEPQPRVSVVRGHQEQLVRKSSLFQMPDNRYCGVCVARGVVDSIRLLTPTTAGSERSAAAKRLQAK